jgi:hypothetical protein
VEYEIHFKQVDGSEFSIEMRYMLAWSCVALLGLTVLYLHYSKRCRGVWNSAGALHPVIWILIAAALLQYAAQFLHLLHLWNYRGNGIGLWTLDALSEILFMLSQVVRTTIFIAIAMGYTLLPSATGQLGLMKAIAALALCVHAALVGFGKLQDDESCKYHENEGAVGWVLLTVRLLLLTWFVAAAQASQQKAGLKLQCFLRQFQLAGALYFLAYPAIFIVVQVFAPYLQHPVLQIGLMIMQTSSVVFLAELFLTRGAYFKVSSLGSSLLPSAGFGMDKTS